MLLLLGAALLAQAAPTISSEAPYSDRFDAALITVCPRAVQSSGRSLHDATELGKSGFVFDVDAGGTVEAHSGDIRAVFVKKPGICHLLPANEDRWAKVRFLEKWTALAKRTYPMIDLQAEIAKPNWIPVPIRIKDAAFNVDFLLVIGHVAANQGEPEVYVVSVAPVSKGS